MANLIQIFSGYLTRSSPNSNTHYNPVKPRDSVIQKASRHLLFENRDLNRKPNWIKRISVSLRSGSPNQNIPIDRPSLTEQTTCDVENPTINKIFSNILYIITREDLAYQQMLSIELIKNLQSEYNDESLLKLHPFELYNFILLLNSLKDHLPSSDIEDFCEFIHSVEDVLRQTNTLVSFDYNELIELMKLSLDKFDASISKVCPNIQERLLLLSHYVSIHQVPMTTLINSFAKDFIFSLAPYLRYVDLRGIHKLSEWQEFLKYCQNLNILNVGDADIQDFPILSNCLVQHTI